MCAISILPIADDGSVHRISILPHLSFFDVLLVSDLLQDRKTNRQRFGFDATDASGSPDPR